MVNPALDTGVQFGKGNSALPVQRNVPRQPAPAGRRIWRLGLVGWLNPGLAYTFGLLGLAITTATMSSLIWATEPALILLLAWLLLLKSKS